MFIYIHLYIYVSIYVSLKYNRNVSLGSDKGRCKGIKFYDTQPYYVYARARLYPDPARANVPAPGNKPHGNTN